MENVYDLVNALEGFTKCKVNFVIDNEHVNADLGELEEINNEVQFVSGYTSAVVEKTNIVNYVEEQ